jgi:hypothetical protein
MHPPRPSSTSSPHAAWHFLFFKATLTLGCQPSEETLLKLAWPPSESISRGSAFGDFVTIYREGSMQDFRVQEYRLHSSLSFFNSNVLRESLSVDSQNIPCATLKRRGGSWVFSIYSYLWPPFSARGEAACHLGCHHLLLLCLGNP